MGNLRIVHDGNYVKFFHDDVLLLEVFGDTKYGVPELVVDVKKDEYVNCYDSGGNFMYRPRR